MLYRVRLGRDEYLGTAEEVVAFMAKAEGSPSPRPREYMAAVARRLANEMGVVGVPHASETAFLAALRERGVASVEEFAEPREGQVDPKVVLEEGPVTLGDRVEADDLPL